MWGSGPVHNLLTYAYTDKRHTPSRSHAGRPPGWDALLTACNGPHQRRAD